MDSVKIVPHEQGKNMIISGDINRIILKKEDTGGTYGLCEGIVFPGGGPPPHLQTREHEGFYILEGEVTFKVKDKEIIVKKGTALNVPPNIIHSFKNMTDSNARILVWVSPGGLEKMFEEVGIETNDLDVKPSPPSVDEKKRLIEIAKKYGVEIKH